MEDFREIKQEDFNMKDLLHVLFGKINVLAIIVITALIFTYIGLQFVNPMYEAKVKILISGQKEIESPYYKELVFGRGADIVMTQSEIVKSKAVLERTVKALQLDKRIATLDKYNSTVKNVTLKLIGIPKNIFLNVKKFVAYRIFGKSQEAGISDFQKAVDLLKKNIKIKRLIETDVFEITVLDYDKSTVKNIANVLGRSYVLFDLEQQLAEKKLKFGGKYPMVLQLEDSIAKMKQDLPKDLDDIEAIGPASVKIIEQAISPDKPAFPRKTVIYILALVLSFLTGLIVIMLYGYFDNSFKSPKDVENYLNIPLLGSLPLVRSKNKFFKKRLPSDIKSFSRQLNILSDQIYLITTDKKAKSLIFTATDPGEGVTKMVFNLAKAISKNHAYKTVVLDCNLRSPGLHNLFGSDNRLGLADVLEDKEKLDKALRKIDENLFFLASGKTELNPVLLLNSTKMQEILATLKDKFDLIIIDAPYLKEYKDAYILSAKADAVVLVVDMSKAKRQIVKIYANLFEPKNKIAGAVFNKRVYFIPQAIYRHF